MGYTQTSSVGFIYGGEGILTPLSNFWLLYLENPGWIQISSEKPTAGIIGGGGGFIEKNFFVF
jgi:hypothetical protein